MKKMIRWIISLSLIFSFAFAAFGINGHAAKSVLIFESTVKVNTTLTVTLSIKADEPMYATEAYVTYNSSVLKFNSGGSANLIEAGKIKIVGTPGGENEQSYNLKFTAIAAGKSTISANNIKYVGDTEKTLPSASDTLTVQSAQTTTSKPVSSAPTISKNANLSSLRVKDLELSPAFSAGTTSYTVIARYPTEQISIFASTQHADATFVGAGTYDLKVGENERIVTVTAEDGKTKKSYFITIKRLTEQETIEYDKQNEVVDTLAVQIGNAPHRVVADLSSITPPTGFTAAKTDYKGTEITVLENADKSYVLYYITNDETEQGDYYTYDTIADVFSPLHYILVDDNIYILAPLPQSYSVPAGYSIVSMPLGNTTTTAFIADEPSLSDFYMLYLHFDGVTQFYRFDQQETTLQRAPYFVLQPQTTDTPVQNDLLAQLNAMSNTEKILLCALGGAILLIIILLVIIIVLVNRKGKIADTDADFGDDLAPFINLEDAAEQPLLEEVEQTEEDPNEEITEAEQANETEQSGNEEEPW